MRMPVPQPIDPPLARLGDMNAVAKIIRSAVPVVAAGEDPAHSISLRRRAIADFCRLLGSRLGANQPPGQPDGNSRPRSAPVAASHPTGESHNASAGASASQADVHTPAVVADRPRDAFISDLPPRLQETLRHLLNGDSEKQVAIKMQLSRHTVHVYVKALYKRFDVNSRAELLSRCLKA